MAFRRETLKTKYFHPEMFSFSFPTQYFTHENFKFIPSPRNMCINTSRHSLFIYLFIYSFVHLFIHPFIHLFIHPFIYLFIYVLLKCCFRSHLILYPQVYSPNPVCTPPLPHVCHMTCNASYR